MPSILWITAESSSQELLKDINLKPYKVMEKGSIVETREGEQCFDHTLCGFDVSTGDFTNFRKMVLESIVWLKANFEELRSLRNRTLDMKLDVGFYSEFVDNNVVAQYNRIPLELMKLATGLEMEIELSQYWHAEEKGAQLN